jgi:hypothetical protein
MTRPVLTEATRRYLDALRALVAARQVAGAAWNQTAENAACSALDVLWGLLTPEEQDDVWSERNDLARELHPDHPSFARE